MKVKALTNFSGLVTMVKGEELDIKDKYIYEDLIRAKYVKEVKKVETKKVEDKPTKKKAKSTKKKVADENDN